jgi:hypothetical protein
VVKEASLETVSRHAQLGKRFSREGFERAFDSFVQTYNVSPLRAHCSPDVLERYCHLFEQRDDAAVRHEVRYRGIALGAAVLPPGTVVFEGEVDEDRMGDW